MVPRPGEVRISERCAHLFVAKQGSSSTGQGRISMVDTRTGNVLRAIPLGIPLGQPRFMSAAGVLLVPGLTIVRRACSRQAPAHERGR